MRWIGSDPSRSGARASKMSRLTVAPTTPVRSLDDLVAIARAVKTQSARRYAEAAGRMREHGSTAAAEILDGLANEDARPEPGAEESSFPTRGRASELRQILPDIFRDETDEMTTSRLATPYRAFAAAVRGAERVFAFWAYLAAYATAAEVRSAAETLAGQELERVARLRRERRRAFQAERTPASGGAPPMVAGPIAAAHLERCVADALDRLAEELAPADAARAREFAGEARTMAIEAAALPDFARAGEADRTDALPVVAERLVEGYLDAADAARDEAAVARAQSLARRAIARLAWLGTVPTSGAS
jgi:hypothetical protein